MLTVAEVVQRERIDSAAKRRLAASVRGGKPQTASGRMAAAAVAATVCLAVVFAVVSIVVAIPALS